MLSEIKGFVDWMHDAARKRGHRKVHYDLRFFVSVVGDRTPKEVTFRDIDRLFLPGGEGLQAQHDQSPLGGGDLAVWLSGNGG